MRIKVRLFFACQDPWLHGASPVPLVSDPALSEREREGGGGGGEVEGGREEGCTWTGEEGGREGEGREDEEKISTQTESRMRKRRREGGGGGGRWEEEGRRKGKGGREVGGGRG